jgi:hypothetical protein
LIFSFKGGYQLIEVVGKLGLELHRPELNFRAFGGRRRRATAEQQAQE